MRDQALLESALAQPRVAAGYRELDIPAIASLYAIALIRNHPFVDGNKRIGAVALETALLLNAFRLVASDIQLLAAIRSLAAGELADDDFTDWVRAHAERSA